MMFTSRKNETRDPEPWQAYWPDGSKAGRYVIDVSAHLFPRTLRFEPREEYKTPANPILVDFRANPARPNLGTPALAELWADALTRDGEDWERSSGNVGNAEHVAHARKVLTRLAKITENKED